MNPADILDLVGDLSVLKFFPSNAGARLAIARLIGRMAADMDQVDWLIARMTSGIYNEWPGPGEMRACFCSRFRPLDGIETSSSVYLDGVPSERPQLAAPPPLALPAGHVASVSDSLDEMVQEIGRRANLDDSIAGVADPRVAERKRKLRLRALRNAPVPTADEIAELKASQREHATHEETRRILETTPAA
jgi:hypothetical protein